MQRWKLIIEYDGRDYCGWQRQDEEPSVQQAIEEAITKFCQKKLLITGAGRTDAGVHARGQVCHFDLDYGERPLGGFALMKALNAHLRPAKIVIVAAEKVPHDFHARYHATNKLYHYRIVQRGAFVALERGLVWHFKKKLDVAAMQEGAKHLLGQHDFTTFRSINCQAKSPEKTLDRLEVSVRDYDDHGGHEILIAAQGRSFLHHQVRNIAGSLVLVGEHKWQPDDVKTALAAKDRTKGGPTAPAHGLYLMRVDYQS